MQTLDIAPDFRLLPLLCPQVGERCSHLRALDCTVALAGFPSCLNTTEAYHLQVGERCTQLRALDCTVARRAGGLLLMGEEPDQLGFRALFTIAANCPLLEVRLELLGHA